jgi:hypothetical protein
MRDFIRQERQRAYKKPGRPPKLTVEDQLLLTLEYRREYRSLFHPATSRGVSEVAVWRIITAVEDLLKRCPDLALPGKTVLRESTPALEIIVVDATETPVERPKKRAALLFGEEKAAHDKDAGGYQPNHAGD